MEKDFYTTGEWALEGVPMNVVASGAQGYSALWGFLPHVSHRRHSSRGFPAYLSNSALFVGRAYFSVHCEACTRFGEIPEVRTPRLVEDNKVVGWVVEYEAFFVFGLTLPLLEGLMVPLVLAFVPVLHHRFR